MAENNAPDYKMMYFTLFDEVEKTIERLIGVQRACEEIYIDTAPDEEE